MSVEKNKNPRKYCVWREFSCFVVATVTHVTAPVRYRAPKDPRKWRTPFFLLILFFVCDTNNRCRLSLVLLTAVLYGMSLVSVSSSSRSPGQVSERPVAGVPFEDAPGGHRAGRPSAGVHAVVEDQPVAGLRPPVLQRAEGAKHASVQRERAAAAVQLHGARWVAWNFSLLMRRNDGETALR